MATPDILTFASNLAPVIPTFTGNGSKVEHPDLQVVFWGPYWPGSGQLTVAGLMQAVSSIVTSPYLEGMRQYGYIGPVNVRQPIVNTGNPNINYPAPGPNVNQVNTALQATYNLVDSLRKNNSMGDVTSNHDLIVLVFLDPSIPFPQNFNAAGGAQTTVFGEHSKYEVSRFLAPAIRFAYGWVATQAGAGLSAFDQSTWTFSHELVEAISNPFVGSGWVQTSPASAAGSGEIGDMCNNTACVVDSIAVQPYWGIQQGACILPTEPRHLSLNQQVAKHVPHDSPVQYAVVDLGPLCGKGNFDYVDRSWDNAVTVSAVFPGYQVPQFTWSINGTVLPAGNSTFSLPCTWELPKATPDFTSILSDKINDVSRFTLAGGGSGMPAMGGAGFAEETPVSIPAQQPDPGKAPAGGMNSMRVNQTVSRVGKFRDIVSQEVVAETVVHPVEQEPARSLLATLHVTVFASVLSIECGPGQGSVSFSVGCQAVENWDGLGGTAVTTKKSGSTDVNMTNQEIIWGSLYTQAAKDCYDKTHKAAGGGVPVGPYNPVDPPEGTINEVDKVRQIQQLEQIGQVGRVEQINKLK